MTDDNLVIRDCSISDIHGVVSVHQRSFPNFFMTKLGPSFLKAYYTTVLDYRDSIFKIASRNEDVVGFAAGFLSPAKFYEFFGSKKLFIGSQALKGILIRPSLILPAIYDLLRVNNASQSKLDDNFVELASIAVDPDLQTRGVGSTLLRSFLSASKEKGARFVILTTDANDNVKTNNFYLRNGFKLNRTFTQRPGRIMNEYIIALEGMEV